MPPPSSIFLPLSFSLSILTSPTQSSENSVHFQIKSNDSGKIIYASKRLFSLENAQIGGKTLSDSVTLEFSHVNASQKLPTPSLFQQSYSFYLYNSEKDVILRDFTEAIAKQSETWRSGKECAVTVEVPLEEQDAIRIEFMYHWNVELPDGDSDSLDAPTSAGSPSTPVSKFKRNLRKRKHMASGSQQFASREVNVEQLSSTTTLQHSEVAVHDDDLDIADLRTSIGLTSSRRQSLQSTTTTIPDGSTSPPLSASSLHRTTQRFQTSTTTTELLTLQSQLLEHQQQIHRLESELRLKDSHCTDLLHTTESRYTDEIQHLNIQHHQKLQKVQQKIHQLEQEKSELNRKFERALEDEKLVQGQKFGKMVHKNKKEYDKLMSECRVLQEKNHEQEKLIHELNQLSRDKDTEITTLIADSSALKHEIQQLRVEQKSREELFQSRVEHEKDNQTTLESQLQRQRDEYNDKIFSIEQLNQQLKQDADLCNEKLNVLRKQVIELTDKNHSLEKQLEQEDLDLSKTYKRLSDVQKANEMLKSDLHVANVELGQSRDALTTAKDEHQREYKSALREMQLLKDRLEQMKNIYEQNLDDERQKNAQKLQKMRDEHADSATALQDLQEKYDIEVKKRIQAVEKIQDLKNEIIVLRNEANESKAQLQQHMQSQAEMTALVESLQAEKRRIDTDLNQSSINLESQKSTLQKLTRENAQLQRQLNHAQREFELLELEDKQRQKQLLVQHERIKVLEKNISMMEEQEMNYKQDIEHLQQNVDHLQETNTTLLRKNDQITAEREQWEFESRNNNTLIDEQQEQIDELTHTLGGMNSKMQQIRAENEELKRRIEETRQTLLNDKNALIAKHKQTLSQIEKDLEEAREEQQQSMLNIEAPMRKLVKALGIDEQILGGSRRTNRSLHSRVNPENAADHTLFGAASAVPTIVIHQPSVSHVHSLNESDIVSQQELDETEEFIHRGLSRVVKETQRLLNEQTKLQDTCQSLRQEVQQKEVRIAELEHQLDDLNLTTQQQVREEKSQLMTQLEVLESQLQHQEASKVEYDTKLRTLELKYDEVQTQIQLEQERHHRELNEMHQQIEEERERRHAVELDLSRARNVCTDLEHSLKSLQDDCAAAIEARENAEAERRTLVQRRDAEAERFKQSQSLLREEMQSKHDSLQNRIDELESDAEHRREEMRSTADALEFAESQRQILLEERNDAHAAIASLQDQLNSVQMSLKQSMEDLSKLESENQRLTQKLEQVRGKLSDKEAALEKATSESLTLCSKLELEQGILQRDVQTKEQDLLLAITRVTELTDQVVQAEQTREAQEVQLGELRAEVVDLMEQLEHTQQALHDFEKNHSTTISDLSTKYQAHVSSLEAQLERIEQHSKKLQTELDAITTERTALSQELTALRTQLAESTSENSTLLEKLEYTKRQFHESQEALQSAQLTLKSQQEDISMLNIQISSLKNDHLDSRGKYEDLERILEQTRKSHEEDTAARVRDHSSVVQNLNELLKSSESLVKEWKEKSISLEEMVTELQNELDANQETLRNVQNNYNAVKSALSTRESECESLKDQVHQIHQQYASVKTELDTTTETEQKNAASLRTMIDNLRTALEQKEQEVVSRNQQYDVVERKMTEYQKQSEQAIKELQGQVEHLQQELNETEGKLRTEVDELSVQRDKFSHLHSNHEQLTQQYQQLTETHATLKATHEALKTQLKSTRATSEADRAELEHKVEQLTTQLHQHLQQMEDLQVNSNEVHDILIDRQQQIDSLQSSLRESQQKNEALYEEISEMQAQLRHERINGETQMEEIQSEYDRFREETTLLIESKKEEIAHLSSSVASLREEFERSQMEKIAENRELRKELEALKQSHEQRDIDVAQLQSTQNEYHSRVEELEARAKSYLRQVEELEVQCDEKQEEIYTLQREVKRVSSAAKNSEQEHQEHTATLTAELKLKESKIVALEEENIRLRDVLATTEGKLKRMAMFEQKYQDACGALDAAEAEHLKVKRELQTTSMHLEDTRAQLESAQAHSEQRVHTMQQQLDEMQATLNKHTMTRSDNEELRAQVHVLDQEVTQKVQIISQLEEQLSSYEETKQQYSVLRVQMESSNAELAAERRQVEELRAELEAKTKHIAEQDAQLSNIEHEHQRQLKKQIKVLEKTHRSNIKKVHKHFTSQILSVNDHSDVLDTTKAELQQLRADFEFIHTNLQSHVARVQQLEQDKEQLRRINAERENTIDELTEKRLRLQEQLDDVDSENREQLRMLKREYEKRIQHLQAVNGPIVTPSRWESSSRASVSPETMSVYESRINALKHELKERLNALQRVERDHALELERVTKRFQIREHAILLQLHECQQRVEGSFQDPAVAQKVEHLQGLCEIERARCVTAAKENAKLRDEIFYLRQNHEEWMREKQQLMEAIDALETANSELDAHLRKMTQSAPQRVAERVVELRTLLSAQEKRAAKAERKATSLQKRLETQVRVNDEKVDAAQLHELEKLAQNLCDVVTREG